MADLFRKVKGVRVKRNAFNLSHENKLTCNMGEIVPIFVRECVPNSDHYIKPNMLLRFQALLSPMMHDVNAYIHFWKVPYRLIDAYFKQFIGGEMDEVDYSSPYFSMATMAQKVDFIRDSDNPSKAWVSSIFDYLRYPLNDTEEIELNSNPLSARRFLAYYQIMSYYYRNENLSEHLTSQLVPFEDSSWMEGDVSDNISFAINALADYKGLMPHAWPKDYFTSALPWVQAGEPVSLGIVGNAPVTMKLTSGTFSFGKATQERNLSFDSFSAMPSGVTNADLRSSGLSTIHSLEGNGIGITAIKSQYLSHTFNGVETPFAEADLSEATAITINELRVANALQVFKERSARFGRRFREYLFGFFNQVSSDATQQEPQWLGGCKVPIAISEVEQTSATDNSGVSGSETPQGHLAGRGTAFMPNAKPIHTHCEEQSIIMGLLFITPKPSYSQGVDRHLLTLNDKYEYFNPSFEHLGEQEIYSSELFATSNDYREGVFGYTPRYAHHRVMMNEYHGQFRDTLSFWHLGRYFNNQPALNGDFIYQKPADFNRVFAVEEVDGKPLDNCLVDIWFDYKAVLPMSKYGTPMLLA